ncbi:MAG: hypothetical protein HY658_06605 [Actinobacteria bacterium]|nr:hypothetical protein [Actinomycetota bacterium]
MRGWLGRRALPAAALAAVILAVLGPGVAAAHGREIDVGVSCRAPDPGRPLGLECTALLHYTDGDPVPDALLDVTGVREGPGDAGFGPTVFEPAEQAGAYSATLILPAYGTWLLRFVVREPGNGAAQLRAEILPPVPGDSPEIEAGLRVVSKFGWPDVRNLALRIAHLVGALAWFGSVALILLVASLVGPTERRRLMGRGAALFPWVAGISLLVVAVSGALNAVYNTPTRPPGLFNPGDAARLPFGNVYLAAFFVKMALAVAIVAATASLSMALRRTQRAVDVIAGGSGTLGLGPDGPERRVRQMAALDLVLGLLVLVVVAVMSYFHIVSHVGGAAGAT